MVNRCDSVDALMYAYCEMMRIKEEKQMLEKNKDYIEFLMHSMMVTHKPDQHAEVTIDGMISYSDFFTVNNPFDIPCDVVVVPKRAFDRLQADNQHYRELAKQREENYNLLLKKTGFDTVESLVYYLNDIHQCDTLLLALANYGNTIGALRTENEQLKKKLNESDPMPAYTWLLKEVFSIDDVEKLEWTLNHTAGGRGSVNGWRAVSSFWSEKYKTLSKLVGFSSVEEIQDYLTNEAECDTLQEAVSKLKDQVKYTCDEWYGANGRNNSWKAAAECNSPKELIEKREALAKEINVYSRALKEWKDSTDCPSPSTAKALLKHYCDENKKLQKKIDELHDNISGRSTVIEHHKRDIEEWQKATGCETPEELTDWGVKCGVANANLAKELLSWQTVTGCSCPKDLSKKIVEWEKIFTPHRSARDLCSAMSNAIESFEYYKKRLGNAVQAASCAAKHLDNIKF